MAVVSYLLVMLMCVSFDSYISIKEWFIAISELMRDKYELQWRLDVDHDLKNISVLSVDPGAMGGTSLAKRGPLWILFLARILLPLLPDVTVFFAGWVLSPAEEVRWVCTVGLF